MSLSREQLQCWVVEQLAKHPHITLPSNTAVSLDALSGDAGFRQYFSVNTIPPLLAVLAPKTEGTSECAKHFSQLSSLLRDQGLPTPQIIECDAANNFLLIEHFGDRDVLSELTNDTVDTLYSQALLVLLRLQQIPREKVSVADYDRASLRSEMELFRQWFVEKLLAYPLSESEHQLIDQTFTFLENQALAQPQVLVHRDYHSRNLMYREGSAPGVIDFQDALWGPIAYDIVSLLRDCYIRWTPEKVKQWVLAYGNMAYEAGIIPATSPEQFMQWVDTVGLQRHSKVLGIFARLSLRDNKDRYLHDLPLVMRYTLEVAAQYPETQAFGQWFEEKLLPIAQTQPWYNNYLTAGDRS